MANNVGHSTVLLLGTQNDAGSITGVSDAQSSLPVAMGGYAPFTIYFESVGTTSGGTLKIEEAVYNANKQTIYTGTWSQIGSDVSASSFTGTAQLAVHIANTCVSHLRVRISADITGGGTVIVRLVRQDS